MRKGFGAYDNHWSATVETKYFGTLRSIGTSKKQIFKIRRIDGTCY